MPIHSDILQQATRLYGTKLSQITPVTGGHFADVYEFTREQEKVILRISPTDEYIDIQSTRSMLEWMAFVANHDGPVSRPVRSQQGNLVETIRNGNQDFLVVAYEKAPGMLAENLPPQDWSDELIQTLGCTLARLHRIAQVYLPVSAELKRPEWEQGGSCFNPRESMKNADRAILQKRNKVLDTIKCLVKDCEGYGLAHLDLHFGNFYVDAARKNIVLLDFDECAYAWYMMDIAMLLFDVLVVYNGLEPIQFGERFLLNLLKGYHQQKRLSKFWVSQLPHFLKLLEIGVYLMLYRSYNPVTADAWVGKFMPGRRERIEQELPYVNLDFAAIYDQCLKLCEDQV